MSEFYGAGSSGPATRVFSITPGSSFLTTGITYARSLYVETGGLLKFTTIGGDTVEMTVGNNFILPVAVTAVSEPDGTATAADGIWGLL